jgi:hypothetical protein
LLGDLRPDGRIGGALGKEHRRTGSCLTRRVAQHDAPPRLDLGGIGLEELLLVERRLGFLDGGELGDRLDTAMRLRARAWPLV